MANSLTAASPTLWSRIMGKKLYKENVYNSLASHQEESVLSIGQIVDRPYRADIVTENYTKGTAATAQDLTATSDQLTVNVIRDVFFYVDSVDKIQNKYDVAANYSEESALRLANDVDAWFLYEVINATSTVDDSSIGGTSGNGITLTISNLIDTYGKVAEKLDAQNVPMDNRFIAISPQWKNVLWKYVEGKHSALGDKTGEFGNIGTYAGFKHYVSNNLLGEAIWVPANNPSNTDTVTIQGITFTFVSTIGSTAGNVLQTVSLTQTLANLAALINAGGVGDAVNYVSVSAANQRAMSKWTAVATSTQITVRVKGASYLTVTGSDATDVWTAAKQIQYILAGMVGSIDLVIQQNPTVKMQEATSRGLWGTNILAVLLFGIKTFNQGKNQIVQVKVRSDAY